MSTEPETRAQQAKAHDVFWYLPAERHDRWWCREGMALAVEWVDGSVHLLDTYWGSSGDRHHLSTGEIGTAEFLFNTQDCVVVRGRDEWASYHPDDRYVLKSQHGLQNTLYVRKGAAKDHGTQVENAREAVTEAESQLRSAQFHLDRVNRDLTELLAEVPHE